jgi:IclR family acetate operon transcriptional repressor
MSSSARRALKVLVEIGAAERPLGVTEIARRLRLAPGTVFRSLDALQKSGYTARYQSSARYVLGPSALGLRQTVFTQFALRDVALPYLRQLASATGESAALIMGLGWYGIRVAIARGSNEITSAAQLGPVGPLARHYGTRPLLSFSSEADLVRYQSWERRERQLPPFPNLTALLRDIRDQGFAREDGNRAGIAVPVYVGDTVLASLALEGPVAGDDNARTLLQEAAAAIAQVVAARPAAFAHPFAHLDPDSVQLEPHTAEREATPAATQEPARQVKPPRTPEVLRGLSKVAGS